MQASPTAIQRIALVTGSNSGIGCTTAQRLVDKGYRVRTLGRDSRRIQEAAEQMGAQPIVADMKHPEDLARAAPRFSGFGSRRTGEQRWH